MAATLKDIAKETGLSIATISKYMNGGTLKEKNRIAIERAVKKLDYTVNEYARGLKSNKSRTIAVIIPELGSFFIAQIITKVEDIMRGRGYSVILCDCHGNEQMECKAVKFVLGKRVDGIINVPVCQDGRHLQPALTKKIPVVLLDRAILSLRSALDCVLTDNAGAANTAADYLLKNGHRRIGILLGPRDGFTARQRLQGYQTALAEFGVSPANHLFAHSDDTVQGGYESMHRLLAADNGMTAVFVTSYELTLGAVLAIKERGIKIPQDLSFIGFDHKELARVMHPSLTIVSQPLDEIGLHAANILLDRLTGNHHGAPISLLLSTRLQHGESVMPLE